MTKKMLPSLERLHSLRKSLRPKLLSAERAFAGRSNFEGRKVDDFLSSISLVIGVSFFLFYFNKGMQVDLGVTVTEIDRLFYSLVSASFYAILFWIISLALLKQTIIRTPTTALLGVFSSIICAELVSGVVGTLLLDLRWDIIWANRVLLAIGPDMTYSMTYPDLPAENWRIWPFVGFCWVLLGAIYGFSDTKSRIFLLSFIPISIVLILFSTNSDLANFDHVSVRNRLIRILTLSVLVFSIARYFKNNSEEFIVNRARSFLTLMAVASFFLLIFSLDPPPWLQSLSAYLSPVPIIGPIFAPLSGPGVEPSAWGGLMVNLIVASAGCVLGLAVGIILAFCRQSQLAIIKWPSVVFIEVFRSGPLICWLYFALFLLGDLADPLFSNPEDFTNILRMMAIFTFFGGVYIAEVIRGGLQSVDSGQKEAAVALGLSPLQTKQSVELPNAIRTTLPSIVSVFIGLWKDTTLLYIIGVLDFLKIASTLSNTDFNFMGYYYEPLFFAAIVFWLPAFYVSRISMKIERSLGLVTEGGAERA